MDKPTNETATVGNVDVEALSHNIARLVEEGGKALAAYLKPREEGKIKGDSAEDITDVVKSVGRVSEDWLSDPRRALEVQTSLGRAYLELWASAVKRMAGEQAEPVIAPDPRDKRFADPELLRETFASNGENLVRGMHMLSEDIQAGQGTLKIRQSDPSMFDVGRNLAVTPGKVVFQNELMQLIQYEATTKQVLKTPLLIVPPWINKFYILDLTPEKSFIKWCVSQGVTVFVLSWVNPDERLAGKSFDEYMSEGVITALDAVAKVTGEKQVHAIGYCVGGTLLSITLAYLA